MHKSKKIRKYLITGTSSGIGKALAKSLVSQGNLVWGVARRRELLSGLKKELGNSPKFIFSAIDISQPKSWSKLIALMRRQRFVPDVVIFNAAITMCDFEKKFESAITKKIFAINFMGILEGVESLLGYLKKGSQLIAISSSSSLKGSRVEGVGYAASKAALSIAFESLYLRFKDKYLFKTIYLGPVASGMGPFRKNVPFCISEEGVVQRIMQAVDGDRPIYHYPWPLFLGLRLVKAMPTRIYIAALSLVDGMHRKLT